MRPKAVPGQYTALVTVTFIEGSRVLSSMHRSEGLPERCIFSLGVMGGAWMGQKM